MKIQLRKRKSKTEATPESVIDGGLQLAYNAHPARLMPSIFIRALNDAGFVIISEADLDAEIALAFQAGEESGRDS